MKYGECYLHMTGLSETCNNTTNLNFLKTRNNLTIIVLLLKYFTQKFCFARRGLNEKFNGCLTEHQQVTKIATKTRVIKTNNQNIIERDKYNIPTVTFTKTITDTDFSREEFWGNVLGKLFAEFLRPYRKKTAF